MSVPSASQFTVTAGQSAMPVSSVAITGMTVIITMQSNLPAGQPALLSYTPGTAPIKDMAGNPAASLTGYSVSNSASTFAVSNAAVSGSSLSIFFSSPPDSSSVPSSADFSVNVNGEPLSVNGVQISDTAVILALAKAIASGQYVQVSYTAGSIPIKDHSGNVAAGFSNQYVDTTQASNMNHSSLNQASYDLKLGEEAYEPTYETTRNGQTMGTFKMEGTNLQYVLQNLGKTAAPPNVAIQVTGDEEIIQVLLPAASFESMEVPRNVHFTIETHHGNYVFPMELIDISGLSNQFRTPLSNIRIGVSIGSAAPGLKQEIDDVTRTKGLETVSSPLTFETFIDVNGKKFNIICGPIPPNRINRRVGKISVSSI